MASTAIPAVSVRRMRRPRVMGRAPDPRCAESNREMLALFENAKRVAAALIGDFTNNINSAGLCERFARDYE